jgi:hypothetical protein
LKNKKSSQNTNIEKDVEKDVEKDFANIEKCQFFYKNL